MRMHLDTCINERRYKHCLSCPYMQRFTSEWVGVTACMYVCACVCVCVRVCACAFRVAVPTQHWVVSSCMSVWKWNVMRRFEYVCVFERVLVCLCATLYLSSWICFCCK